MTDMALTAGHRPAQENISGRAERTNLFDVVKNLSGSKQGPSFSTKFEKDPITNETYLVFPEELLSGHDWQIGDEIGFEVKADGSLLLTNLSRPSRGAKEMPLFIVDTITTHRVRYAVRCKSLEDAMDTVATDELSPLTKNTWGYKLRAAMRSTYRGIYRSVLPGCLMPSIET